MSKEREKDQVSNMEGKYRTESNSSKLFHDIKYHWEREFCKNELKGEMKLCEIKMAIANLKIQIEDENATTI